MEMAPNTKLAQKCVNVFFLKINDNEEFIHIFFQRRSKTQNFEAGLLKIFVASLTAKK